MERRLWYVIIVIFLILVNQSIHLRKLYQTGKEQYVYQHNDIITAAIYEFNHKAMNLKHLLSYNASKNTIIYIINQKITRFQLHEEDDVQSIHMRACYDLRSPQLWTLENFNTLLQMKLDSIQTKTLSLQFVIQDSTGKVKEAYPNPQKTLLSSHEYKQPLGFISGDMLFATYDYPFILFFQEAFEAIVLTIIISFLFLWCIIHLYRIIHDEKMKRKYQMSFIDNLVHDLKRPIENQLEICKLLPSLTPAQQTSFLERSYEQLNDMLQFTNHMLLQSMDVYDKQLHMREFDIQKMLETLKQKDRWHLYKSKSFDIQTDIHLTSSIISGDEQILFTVFQNFIDNSLKYSGERVNIQITCMDIDPRYIQIRFEDNGLGIASKELKHVFERFYRGDSQKNKKVKGYGLGLYHARMFILAHGGKINIESEVNEGTTVFVTLPRKGDIKRRFKFSHI